jgi:hypothetical protein
VPEAPLGVGTDEDRQAVWERRGIPGIAYSTEPNRGDRNAFLKRVYREDGRWNGPITRDLELVLSYSIRIATRPDDVLAPAVRDLAKVGAYHGWETITHKSRDLLTGAVGFAAMQAAGGTGRNL